MSSSSRRPRGKKLRLVKPRERKPTEGSLERRCAPAWSQVQDKQRQRTKKEERKSA